MSWITLPLVGIDNGKRQVSIEGASTANINIGDALQIGNYELAEISGIYSDSLELKNNWTNPSVVSGRAVVVPTFGNFNTATQALRQATTVTQGNFAAMEKWGTDYGFVTFKAYDNTEHVVRTAKEMDKAVKAIETGLDSVVSEAVAEVSPANINWDVEIDFNDGIGIKKGYGASDSNGNKVVNFSRASTSTNINKSGVLETLAADEPTIGSKGIGVYGAHTNKLLWSESFSNAVWLKFNCSTISGQSDPKGGSTAFGLIEDSSNNQHYIQQATLASGAHTVSFFVKKINEGESRSLRLRMSDNNGFIAGAYFNLATKSTYSLSPDILASIKELSGGWFLVSCSVASSSSNAVAQLFLVQEGTTDTIYQGDGVSGVVIFGAQLIESEFVAQYIPTTSSPATRAADIVSVPIMGNLPAPGKPFTVALDCAIPQANAVNKFVFSITPTNTYFRRVANGLLQAVITTDTGVFTAQTSAIVDSLKHRFIVRYDTNKLEFFIDGVSAASIDTTGIPDYNPSGGNITLGAFRSNVQQIDSEIAAFRVIHRALSDGEIIALGGPK
ncbi:hypothetical protein HYO45_13155 [Vibrio parahaemolyticus]|nr:hypothetical protein [Vibrio parahaemolyticus]